ncbi:MAG: hypothetical protein QOG21_473 [Actinomycetota bacterium]|nr:hypothetical protein [Actinomycetota bacterium]
MAQASGSPARTDHLYGGQAVPEGVMMRGADHWAVAVRQPTGAIYVESHAIDSVTKRHPVLRKPFLRGIIVLGQSLAIGVKALLVASNESTGSEDKLSSKQMGITLAVAMALFVGIFLVGPAALFGWVQHRYGGAVWTNVTEGVFRVVLFVGYLWAIGRTKEVHRVFEYHGAEHKTIAAHEHDVPLEPAEINRFPKEHVRCGTNFLIIVMLVTVVVFSLIPTPGIAWRLASRVIAVPVIAGLSYEALRLGARFERSAVMRALMAPGIWLQHITTQEPAPDQLEVAIRSFQEVLDRESQERVKAP